MKITLRTKESQQRVIIQTDDGSTPPTMIKFPGQVPQQIALDWSGALDDEKSLKRCPACGCKDMYVSNNFPQITTLVSIALAAVVCLVLIYHKWIIPAAIVLAVVIVLDILIYLFKKPALICYDCRSEFRSMPIGKHHQRWEQGLGERYKRKNS
ncbi:MAG TPA: hypothetical protein DCM28_22065 [Phycisphaerales bacterium]|nr:hypothetical protein [Phycisphaerales bacterium]HCD34752.1 hypothetical protein [Phycisphaerales bacterium]